MRLSRIKRGSAASKLNVIYATDKNVCWVTNSFQIQRWRPAGQLCFIKIVIWQALRRHLNGYRILSIKSIQKQNVYVVKGEFT